MRTETLTSALGVAVDGVWGPLTEDAIQRALLEKEGGAMPCDADSCPSPVAEGSGSGVSTMASKSPNRRPTRCSMERP